MIVQAHTIDLGKIVGMSGRYDEARRIFSHALKLDPTNAYVGQLDHDCNGSGGVAFFGSLVFVGVNEDG